MRPFFFYISVLWAMTIGHKSLLPRQKMKTSPQAKHYTLSLILIFFSWGGGKFYLFSFHDLIMGGFREKGPF